MNLVLKYSWKKFVFPKEFRIIVKNFYTDLRFMINKWHEVNTYFQREIYGVFLSHIYSSISLCILHELHVNCKYIWLCDESSSIIWEYFVRNYRILGRCNWDNGVVWVFFANQFTWWISCTYKVMPNRCVLTPKTGHLWYRSKNFRFRLEYNQWENITKNTLNNIVPSAYSIYRRQSNRTILASRNHLWCRIQTSTNQQIEACTYAQIRCR